MTDAQYMFDTAQADYGSVPDGAGAICPYMDRRFNNVAAAARRFPRLVTAGRIMTITAASGDADCVDWEPGNLNPSPAGWYDQQHGHGRWRPCFYADLSDMEAHVIPALQAHIGGLGAPGAARKVRIFTAHPTGRPHLCGPHTCGFPWDADMTQWFWTSIQGRWPSARGDIDASMFRADAFKPVRPPGPFIDTGNYGRFADDRFPYGRHGAKFLRERDVVKRRDHLIAHPKVHAHELAVLHDELVFLRKRVWFEAVKQHPLRDGKPSWGEFDRGWRWKQLRLRTEGK